MLRAHNLRLLSPYEADAANRNLIADSAKAVAEVLVVAGHLINCDIAKLPVPYYFSDILNIVHMPLFCLIGGYFSLRLQESPFLQMLKKSMLRILLPYLVWSTVAVAAKAGMTILNGTFSLRESLTLWYTTLLLGKSLWFFLTLFLVRVLAWAVFRLRAISGWLAAAVLALIAIIPFPGETELYFLLRLHDLLPIFCLGCFLHNSKKLNALLIKHLFSGTTLFVCCLLLLTSPFFAALYRIIPDGILRNPLSIVMEAAMLPGVFLPICMLLHKLPSVERQTARWGLYTMDVYCIHMVFVEYLRFQMPESVLSSIQVVSSVCYLFEAILITGICVLIARLLHSFFSPYHRLMSGSWKKP